MPATAATARAPTNTAKSRGTAGGDDLDDPFPANGLDDLEDSVSEESVSEESVPEESVPQDDPAAHETPSTGQTPSSN